jgi:flagellar assembly protein FliH
MSSRIVRGNAARDAAPVPWAAAQGVPAGRSIQSGLDPNVASRVSELEAQLETRVRDARQAGLREGQLAAEQRLGEEVRQAVKNLARGVAELAAIRDRLRREAEQDVVQLAIEIARRVLHREIAADAEALLGLTRAALQRIDVREIHRVRVHPASAGALESALAEIGAPQRIEVHADATLEPGGLLFETSRGSCDVSVATQLREIERGFVDLLQRGR